MSKPEVGFLVLLCSYDTPATAGMLATARIPAASGTPPSSKGHQQKKAQHQQQKCMQQQDLRGNAIKVARKKARNMAGNVTVIKNLMAIPKVPWFCAINFSYRTAVQ